MADSDIDKNDLAQSQILKERTSSVREMRLASTKKPTNRSAETPHLFQEIHQPTCDYIGIPRVVSENRRFYTVAHLPADVIAADSVFTITDPTGLYFGIISSSMFISWQKAVGGRLKSDLRFSNTLVWNTFPVPELDDATRQEIIDAGKGVLAVRELFPDRSLAEHYRPGAEDPQLLAAHDVLDVAVDKAFGAEEPLTTERKRLEILFARYAEMTGQ